MFTGSTVCSSFLAELFQGIHNFSSNGDVFLVALYSDAASLTASTAGYTSAGEINGPGYTAGGAQVPTSLGVATAGQIAFPQFLPVKWTPGPLTARGALLYNSTKGNRAVAVMDFGLDYTQSPFVWTPPGNGSGSALIRVVGSVGAYS
jgi:hypothetical protein